MPVNLPAYVGNASMTGLGWVFEIGLLDGFTEADTDASVAE